MTGGDLLAEGLRLTRPCVYLRTTGDELAAFWKGQGVVPCEPGPFRHWLSFNRRHIPGSEAEGPGCLSLYTNNKDCVTGVVAVDEYQVLPADSDGIPLYAHPASSMPPLEAIFRLGSHKLMSWLAANNWNPEWGYNENFPDRTPVDVYERAYQDQSPLYNGSAHAVLGGWHMPWPDDADWDGFLNKQLVIWTIADAEPWVEVWHDGVDFQVIQRIT